MPRKTGRPPKPVAVHRLQGTFEPGQHAARGAVEPVPVGEIHAEAPEWLTEEGQEIWRAIFPTLIKGAIGASDLHLLASYCDQAATHMIAVRAQRKLDAGLALPLLAKGREGQVVASPYVAIIRRAALAMAQLGADLGIGPTARARIGSMLLGPGPSPQQPAKTKQPEDPWSDFAIVQGGKR